MGLDEGPTAAEKPESVAEKRERLLNALQKCDEDLKALKKIIEAVRSADQQRTPSTEVISKNVSCFGDKIRTVTEVTCSEQQPSPVSVLDELTRSPVSFRNYSQQQSHSSGRVQQQKIQVQKKPGEENTCFYERIATSELVHKKVKDDEEEEESVMWSRRAMKESVEEVCRDIAWGEKREIGRIGLALHDHICRDLIDEIVRDLGFCCFNALPFEACKRRLAF
ncbi:uncharacterized protein LOC114724541 [Neltuma alba]|uniref:uncharacterized protein LOC114724541 n=1 Tax=Neltuma alba TaxID=207710 RepID=UPI0010A419A7|nr:uncharacterized protein LOC114724541 [Prosopis alba]